MINNYKRSTVAIGFIQVCSIFIKDVDMLISISPRFQWVGLGFIALAISIFLLAIITMHDNWMAGIVLNEEISLVNNGIYRYRRNSAFWGFDLLYIGFALVFPNWILIAVSCIVLIVIYLRILEEERHLSVIWGKAYQKYLKNTPRYFLFF